MPFGRAGRWNSRERRPSCSSFVRNEERFYRPKAVPILDPGGEPAGVVLILHDVTQQRQLDEKKSGAGLGGLPQLKTPLTSIRMAIHLLLEEKVGGLSPKQVDILVAAGEDAERLVRIVDELLDIGRIESGKARMDLRPVPPIDLVFREMEAYRPAARDGGVSLVVEPAGDTAAGLGGSGPGRPCLRQPALERPEVPLLLAERSSSPRRRKGSSSGSRFPTRVRGSRRNIFPASSNSSFAYPIRVRVRVWGWAWPS